jgi:3-dehydrosphinganine reductase
MKPLDSFDYYHYQDKVLSALWEPIKFIILEVPLSTQVFCVMALIFILGVVLPLGYHTYKYIKALCHPVTFPYKHVLITGCSGGLGKALVQEIFMKGAYITMVGRDKEVLRKIAEQVDVNNKKQPLISSIIADLSEFIDVKNADEKYKQFEKSLEQAEARYGPIEVVICCAGMSLPTLFVQSEFMQYFHHMNLNFFSVVRIIHTVAKKIISKRPPYNKHIQGRFVLIGDPLSTHYGIPGMTPYSCSKAALEQFAYLIKTELEPYDMNVHYFLPPPMNTKLLTVQK